MTTAKTLLDGLFRTAIAAAHPSSCLPPHLPLPPAAGRLIVLAAGKAAGAMTEVAEQHYLDRAKLPPERLMGVAVARHGYGRPSRRIEMIEAGHPVPDAAGLAAAEKALAIAEAGDLTAARAYEKVADWLLFDAKPPKSLANALPGGNGLVFDWTLLTGFESACPWMLSGGLDADNVAEAARISGARAVDVSSGVESEPGLKDPDRIRAFAAAARS